jgi:hypothetical protein
VIQQIQAPAGPWRVYRTADGWRAEFAGVFFLFPSEDAARRAAALLRAAVDRRDLDEVRSLAVPVVHGAIR